MEEKMSGEKKLDERKGSGVEKDPCCEQGTPCIPQDSKEVEECGAEDDFRDQWLRALAEHENLRKRMDKENREQVKYAIFKFAKELLTVADNLSRALESLPEALRKQKEISPFYEGVSLTSGDMSRLFTQFHIQPLVALGQSFDPHMHQVVGEQESDCAPHTVVEVLQEGYRLHDRLLRPALVIIAKKPVQDDSSMKS